MRAKNDTGEMTRLDELRYRNKSWSDRQGAKAKRGPAAPAATWKRETFKLPREEARAKARDFLDRYPKAAYWSEVESWRVLPNDVIEFTMRRLPSAD